MNVVVTFLHYCVWKKALHAVFDRVKTIFRSDKSTVKFASTAVTTFTASIKFIRKNANKKWWQHTKNPYLDRTREISWEPNITLARGRQQTKLIRMNFPWCNLFATYNPLMPKAWIGAWQNAGKCQFVFCNDRRMSINAAVTRPASLNVIRVGSNWRKRKQIEAKSLS